MWEILLGGLAVVGIYLVAHHAVMAIERLHGRPLGAWRSGLFFLIFLVLMLLATWLAPELLAGTTAP